jgi:hypothetical protein
MIHDAGTRAGRFRALLSTSPTVTNTALPTSATSEYAPPLTQERNGYWFPMLLFGVLTLAAPLVYRPSGASAADWVWNPAVGTSTHIEGIAFAPLQQFGTCDAALGDPMSVALYWFCVVMFAPLVTLLWYQQRARRDGVAPQTGWHLLYASTSLALYVVLFPVIEFVALQLPDDATESPSRGTMVLADVITVGGFVIGLVIAAAAALPRRFGRRLSTRRWTVTGLGMLLAIASAAAIEFLSYLQPRSSYGALMIIAVGLLALAMAERGRVCAVIAVLFTAVALVVNLVGLGPVLGRLGLVTGHSAVATAFGNLVVPAAILIVGGLVGVAGRFVGRGAPV